MTLPKSKVMRGRYFETIASAYLSKNGYKILSQNYQDSHREIDIICEKKSVIHFVEVKGRTSKSFGEITETITNKKERNLIHAATNWMTQNRKVDDDWQIDFIGIEMQTGSNEKITFIENAISEL